MEEAPKWPGLWMCPDYKNSIGRDGERFLYKCQGMEITEEAANEFDKAVLKVICESN